jgi:hypothetical protein
MELGKRFPETMLRLLDAHEDTQRKAQVPRQDEE